MNVKERLLSSVTTHSEVLKWALALLVVNASTYGFAMQHGTLKFDNEVVRVILSCFSCLLVPFVIFRLFKPRSAQDIQALILLLLLPNCFSLGMLTPILIAIVLLFRWNKVARIVGASLAIPAVAAVAYIGVSLSLFHHQYTAKPAALYSRTDGIYCLYGSKWKDEDETRYFLLRQVQLLPGISLASWICDYASYKPVTVIHTPEGKYKVVDIPSEIQK